MKSLKLKVKSFRFLIVFLFLLSTFYFLLSDSALAVSFWPLVPCGLQAQPKDSNGVELPKTGPNGHDYTQLCNRCDLLRLLKNIIDFVLVGLMPPAAAILFVWGGFLILMGGANPGWITQGRTIFWNTAIGVAIISASWLITNTIIRSVAADNVAPEWWKLECRVTVPAQQLPAPEPQPPGPQPEPGPGQPPAPQPPAPQPPAPQPPAPQPPAPVPQPPSSTLACMFNGVNYSTLNLCSGQRRPGGCGTSVCSQYLPSIQRYAGGAATVDVLKTFMVIESDCNIKAGTGTSYGLMQISPATGNPQAYKCGVPPLSVTSGWLTNPANADKSICLGAAIINSIAAGTCGSQPRNIYAGYNAGPGYCAASRDCATEQSCGGGTKKKWECPYDNPQHTTCNTGMYQTKQGATYVNYCLNHLGF